MSLLQKITCHHAGTMLEGQLATPDGSGPFPVVLVFPSALGLGEHALAAVRRLAENGYLGLGVDMYGGGLASSYTETNATGAQFEALVGSPEFLRERALAWLETARMLPQADPARIAAIGYCFGGFCVLELARTGADVKAVVSYHGLLTSKLPAAAGAIKGEVAAYCGAQDPYAPMEHITMLRKELEAAGAHYQITVFGDAEHSFTDPNAALNDRPGVSYNLLADRVSWTGTLAILDAVLR